MFSVIIIIYLAFFTASSPARWSGSSRVRHALAYPFGDTFRRNISSLRYLSLRG